MNFFAHQDRARRGSRYYTLLTSVIVLGPALLWGLSTETIDDVGWAEICVAMLLFISVSYWFLNRKLKDGGSAIAERYGGYLISLDPHENDRWLLDIVEEMAIASGSPVPMVYLLDADGINAFAAGRTPQDAVIAVTYGAAAILDREEMQGVIAHLFSAIHSNDMRLDTRMKGVHLGSGLLVLIIGLSSASLLPVGLGWIFLMFLAMSRVRRQRKYLADAAAAQFTRNPQSVASALRKIGGHEYGALIGYRDKEDCPQMFFATPFKNLEQRLDSPYPPLEKRIWRLDPDWDGEYPEVP